MNDTSLLLTTDHRGVARITLNRPAVRNAFNEEMVSKLCDLIGTLNANEDIRVIVITGAGEAFCAGEDVNMMRQYAEEEDPQHRDDTRRLAHMLRAIYESGKPIIARVNGATYGCGIGLVAACDIAIAAESSTFSLSEVRLGVIPAVSSPYVVRAIGPRPSRRYFMTGEKFTAATALSLGLLHSWAPDNALDASVDEIIDNLLLGGPNAQLAAKDLIRTVAYHPINNAITEDTAGLISKIRVTREAKEGLTAFMEKRSPSWVTKDQD